MNQKSGRHLAEFSAYGLTRWKSRQWFVREEQFLSGGWGRNTLIQVVGRIPFLPAVRLRLPLLCWLLAGGFLAFTGCSLVLAPCPLHFQGQQLCIRKFFLPQCYQSEKTLPLKGLIWLGQVYSYSLYMLRSIDLRIYNLKIITAVLRLLLNWITRG